MSAISLRQLGNSDLQISSVGFGCWPIAGISSLGVTRQSSLATIEAALDTGINFFDSAYSYGYDGEADGLLRQVLTNRREGIVLASKVGSHYNQARQRCVDCRPEVLKSQAEQLLRRLGVECLDLLYLHQPDPEVAIEDSAGAIAEIVQRGWARYAAVSNVDLDQLQRFNAVCPVVAVQPPYNMLQQQELRTIQQYCLDKNIGAVCYWVLMKGLLAGRMDRNHQFDPCDRRLTYSIYQGQQWDRSQDFLDKLRELSRQLSCTVAQLVVAWTIQQPTVISALCGAKRPEQIQETAQAMRLVLEPSTHALINGWLQQLNNS